MQQNQLSEEQKNDIESRVASANAFLKESSLVAAVQSISCNLGAVDPKFNGIFGTYLQVYLQDTKYSVPQKNSVPSTSSEVNPLVKKDESNQAVS
jgi:hypothetical protein